MVDYNRYGRYYDEGSFWDKLANVARKAGARLVYPALKLYYILKSNDVSVKDKAIIVGALGYLILPTDIVPDIIPVVGLTDDLAGLLLALRTVKKASTPDIKRQARQQAEKIMNANG